MNECVWNGWCWLTLTATHESPAPFVTAVSKAQMVVLFLKFCIPGEVSREPLFSMAFFWPLSRCYRCKFFTCWWHSTSRDAVRARSDLKASNIFLHISENKLWGFCATLKSCSNKVWKLRVSNREVLFFPVIAWFILFSISALCSVTVELDQSGRSWFVAPFINVIMCKFLLINIVLLLLSFTTWYNSLVTQFISKLRIV